MRRDTAKDVVDAAMAYCAGENSRIALENCVLAHRVTLAADARDDLLSHIAKIASSNDPSANRLHRIKGAISAFEADHEVER